MLLNTSSQISETKNESIPQHEVTLVADLPLSPIFPVQNPFNSVKGTFKFTGQQNQNFQIPDLEGANWS